MLTFDNSVTFLKGKEPEIGLRNFWEPENGFVWSTGKWCEVHFAFDRGGKAAGAAADLILDIDAFKVPEKFDGQNFMIYLNGLRIGSHFCVRRTPVIASFETDLLNSADNILTIDTPDVALPKEHGLQDSRLLGLQLFSVQIRKTT
ncbi:MAG: hypothetical protein ABR970_10995 [Roseiarcus sp.]|jgi:hypothetical protein